MPSLITLATVFSLTAAQAEIKKPDVQVTFSLTEKEYSKHYQGEKGLKFSKEITLQLISNLKKNYGFINFIPDKNDNKSPKLSIHLDAVNQTGLFKETRFYLTLSGSQVKKGEAKFDFRFREDEDYIDDVTNSKNFRTEILTTATSYLSNNTVKVIHDLFSNLSICKGGHHVSKTKKAAPATS